MADIKTKIYDLDLLSRDELGIIDRQWIRANYAKEHYERTFAATDKEVLNDMTRFYVSEAGTFMWLWYSLLFSVMERLREKNVETTDQDFEVLFISMKRARNSIFHAENEYWDARQMKLLEIENVGGKLRSLHDEIGGLLMARMRKK